MKRFVAFLRGVSPMNCKMPELKRAFEAACFTEVKTLLSSGNVAFDASGAERTVRKKAEAAMEQHLDQGFVAFVRPQEELLALLAADPFARFKLAADAKRVVTFLQAEPDDPPKLPVELDGARILALQGRELFSAYVPGPKGPVFMALIEKTFGKDVTTRTWDTVRKAANV
ncbi:DUF1697 domain-containing protein [Ramlibacter sp. XY19]|uniref:DUF1697 domain-containing protein n=1 Tax=Ramlibacter paludis TaxID=2908000 RepID=UPI0023DA6520|nr:DUF1697 domain-containing protein [Ramlibacter paludis]MCG2591524.1 DUF1697 domain-containing protein [Ramlibacter paludis]